MRKIKREDDVVVIAGKDKGSHGKIVRVLGNDRVIVGGVNLVKRHTKPNPALGRTGGIVEKEAGIHVSNIAIVNPATGKADKVGIKVLEDGKKVRVFKSNGQQID